MRNCFLAIPARMTDAAWLSELKICRDGITDTFPNYSDNLALAVLVPRQTADATVFLLTSRLRVAAE
jgi:hypothetical protein